MQRASRRRKASGPLRRDASCSICRNGPAGHEVLQQNSWHRQIISAHDDSSDSSDSSGTYGPSTTYASPLSNASAFNRTSSREPSGFTYVIRYGSGELSLTSSCAWKWRAKSSTRASRSTFSVRGLGAKKERYAGKSPTAPPTSMRISISSPSGPPRLSSDSTTTAPMGMPNPRAAQDTISSKATDLSARISSRNTARYLCDVWDEKTCSARLI